MFGSMVARCQQTAALKLNVSRMYPQNAVGMRKIVEKEEAKLPGQVQLPYGKQVGIVCVGQPHRWIAPVDRATFPQDDDSIETSEREAR